MRTTLFRISNPALKNIISASLPIFLATLLLFLPIVINPALYLNRGNDLQEFFWPIYYFVKNQILSYGTFPLWNNIFLSGTPLLPDPQSPLFYPPNLIFLFLSLDTAFIISAIIHVFMGGIGIYLVAKNCLKFSHRSAITTAVLYVTSSKVAAYLEAGHVGLVASWAWVPFVIFASLSLARKPSLPWSLLLAISMSGLFFTHTITFLIVVTSLPFFFTLLLVINKKIIKPFLYIIAAALFGFGFSAITLLPQLAWNGLTTRYLLLEKPQIFPIWHSAKEYFTAVFYPQAIDGGIAAIVSEKWIVLGLFLPLLAAIGFIKLKSGYKLAIILILATVTAVSLGNASPLYPILIKQSWFITMRIPTRAFFILIIVFIFLAGYALDLASKKRSSHTKLVYLFVFLSIAESLFLSWSLITRPPNTLHHIPNEIYNILSQDKSRFRTLCLTRCISQKEAAKRGLELVEGYSTLTQKNYYSHALQLIGGYWDFYSIPIPPTGVYLFQDLKPNINSLAEYNVKYIIYTKKLGNPDIKLIGKYGDFYLYENMIVQPRASAPIIHYSPNKIIIDTSGYSQPSVILSEVYSPGWKAYLNGTEEIPVQETPNSLRSIPIKEDTQFIKVKYQPKSYSQGKAITAVTYLLLITYLSIRPKRIPFKTPVKNRP